MRSLIARLAILLTRLGMKAGAQVQLPSRPSAHDAKVSVLWLGQSAFRIATPGGKSIVINPWLTKSTRGWARAR